MLTQAEADALLGLPKRRVDDREWDYRGPGDKLMIPLESADGVESFLLDIDRQSIVLTKGKYQMRGRRVHVLARLDFGGSDHQNPDGAIIPCPHLHLYREDFGDRWAMPIPADFSDITDLKLTLVEFMAYCNVVTPPKLRYGMFI